MQLLAAATNCGTLDHATCQAAQEVGTAIGVGLLIFLAIGFIAYFVPSMIALGRRHPKKGQIILVNVLLGWSLVGWIVSLVWAFSSPQPPQTIVVQLPSYPPPPAHPVAQ
jgi:cation transporter-like permease